MKRAGAVLLALGMTSVVGSCGGNEEVTIVLLDPCKDEGGTSFREASVYTEILVVKNGCPSDADLAAGKVENVEFQGIAESTGKLPSVGDLAKGKYGFVVLVKDANCGVVGFGCTAADLENIREVRIAVRAWTSANTCQPLTGGKCPAPKTCEEGRCVGEPSGDGGSGCDLTVLADGVLPSTDASVTGPGIVATPTGFVIGYREYASDGGISATLVPLSDAGDLGTPSTVEVDSCAGQTLTDGVGMAFQGSAGLFAASLPDCGGGAGAAFVPFESDGTIGSWSAPHNPAFSGLTLARTHSVAPARLENEWEFVYRAVTAGAGGLERGIILINAFKNTPIEYLFGSVDAQFGQVATGSTARGFLGGGIPGEAGTSTSLGLSAIGTTDAALPLIGEVPLPSASWSAITAWGAKVAAGVPDASGFTWSAVSVSSSSVTPLVDQATLGSGSVSSGDMVVHGDSLLVALGKSGTITAYRLTGATGSLSETPEVTSEVTATGFSGTQMAIAAARSRLAIAWLGSGTSTGGYALLQCSE